VPAGWELNSATCDNGETIGSIDLEPGETVTCTLTNTLQKQTPTVTTEIHFDDVCADNGDDNGDDSEGDDGDDNGDDEDVRSLQQSSTSGDNGDDDGDDDGDDCGPDDGNGDDDDDGDNEDGEDGDRDDNGDENGDSNNDDNGDEDGEEDGDDEDDGHAVVTGPLALGATVHDKATVSGSGPMPTGFVTFSFFTGGDCTTGTLTVDLPLDTVELVLGVAHPSLNRGPLAAGSYAFLAEYSGDENYTGATSLCEPFTVEQATPKVTTVIHIGDHNGDEDDDDDGDDHPDAEGVSALRRWWMSEHLTVAWTDSGDEDDDDDDGFTSAPLGSIVHDKATVKGIEAFTPTGDVSFTFYTSSDDCTGPSDVAGSRQLVGNPGIAHPSNSFGPLTPGSYSFQASYLGDANYSAAVSRCEPLTVEKAKPRVATVIHIGDNHTDANGDHDGDDDDESTSAPLGSIVHDKAIVTGVAAFAPTGSVTFTFYNDDECDGTGTAAGMVALDGLGVAHPSLSQGPLEAGSYSFRASYLGDSNYRASVSQCEPLTVRKASTSTATAIHNHTTHAVVTSVPAGTTVHDEATVTGQIGSFVIGGKVSFTFYTNGTCSGSGTALGMVGVVNGVAHPSASRGPLVVGWYSFRATYNGDANYKGSSSSCEQLQVGVLGRTMNFWGNSNGRALLDANNDGMVDTPSTIGLTGKRVKWVDELVESNKIEPNQLNSCGKGTPLIFATTSTLDCTLSSGLNKQTLNTLAGQTLALSYNISYITGYSGQTSAGLSTPTNNCSALLTSPLTSLGLTSASTVNDVLGKANLLLANSQSGGTTTQAQAGAMNSLLGCLNRETP